MFGKGRDIVFMQNRCKFSIVGSKNIQICTFFLCVYSKRSFQNRELTIYCEIESPNSFQIRTTITETRVTAAVHLKTLICLGVGEAVTTGSG